MFEVCLFGETKDPWDRNRRGCRASWSAVIDDRQNETEKPSFRRLWSEGEEEQQGEMHEKRCLHSGTVTKL